MKELQQLVWLELNDLEKLYESNINARIIDGQDELSTKEAVQQFVGEVFSDEDTTAAFVASCKCRSITGDYHIGAICPECRTEVKEHTFSSVEYKLWIELPIYAAPALHPRAFDHIKKALGKADRVSILDWLLGRDTGGITPRNMPEWYTPGWNSFYKNFDALIKFFVEECPLSKRAGSKDRIIQLSKYVTRYRDRLFTRHFPVIDSTLHLMSSYGEVRRIDPAAKLMTKLIIDMSVYRYNYEFLESTEEQITLSMNEVYATYLDYQKTVRETILNGKSDIGSDPNFKKGILRHEMMGMRMHFSFRGVITPLSGPHFADELHLPWRIGIECMRLELTNILVHRMGMSVQKSFMCILRAQAGYEKSVAEALEILVSECPYKGLPVLFCRNPGIRLGAMQLFFVTKFLVDANAISLSPLVLEAPNADFDGDCMNGEFIKEMGAVPFFMNLHPSVTMYSTSSPGIGKTVGLSDQTVVMTQNWLASNKEVI